MRAYSMDLRVRVLADSDAGMGTRVVAAKYRVSESWVRWLKQRRTPPLVSGRRRGATAGLVENMLEGCAFLALRQ